VFRTGVLLLKLKSPLALLTVGAVIVVGLYVASRPGKDQTSAIAPHAPVPESPVEQMETVATAPEPAQPAEDTVQPVEEPEPALEETDDAERFAFVSGVVKDEQDLPIVGAEVLLVVTGADPSVQLNDDYIQPSRVFTTTSDGRGRYTIEHIPFEGRAIVVAGQESYVTHRSQYVSLELGQTYRDVDITLLPGKSLRGEVFALDGTPVAGAVVEVHHVWNPKDYSISTRFAETDAAGRFTLNFGPEAEWCTLRVDSDTHGQSFFIRVPVTDEEIQLTMPGPAILRGTISWDDGAPAEGVTVFLDGTLPEPDTGVWRTGIPPKACFRAIVDGEGHYEIANIYPGLEYLASIGIPDPKYPYNRFRATPLSSRNKGFRFNPGEVVVWDCTTASAITIQGHVRTEHTGQSVADAYIAVRKDGQPIHIEHSDNNGFYEIRLGTGAGVYQVFPLTPLWSQLDMYEGLELDRRFGKEFRLEGGEDIKADLNLFEPIVLPIRVVDFQGNPITRAGTELHLITVAGRRYGIGNRSVLFDKDGRKTFLIHMPLSEFWVEVLGGPKMEGKHYTARPGDVLREETFVLDPSCHVTGIVLDPDGYALGDTRINIEARYGDGFKDQPTTSTNDLGVFESHNSVRANKVVTLHLYLDIGNESWTSEPIECPPGQTIDLGEIVLSPTKEEATSDQ